MDNEGVGFYVLPTSESIAFIVIVLITSIQRKS